MALTRVKNPGNFTVDGNVGIGTSSFNSKLEVKGESSNGSVRVIPNSDNAEASIGYYQDTAGTNMTDRWVAGVGGWGNTNQFTIGNSGSPKLKIDTSGRVTMPNQPSFFAYLNNTFTGVGLVPFDNTVYNTGNHFNTSNGRFTAPVTGVYMFTVIMASGTVQTARHQFLAVNTTRYRDMFEGDDFAVNSEKHASALLRLTANDVVDFRNGVTMTVQGGGHYYYSAFMGHLLG